MRHCSRLVFAATFRSVFVSIDEIYSLLSLAFQYLVSKIDREIIFSNPKLRLELVLVSSAGTSLTREPDLRNS